VYIVDQIVWDDPGEKKRGSRMRLIVLANSITEACKVAGEDEQHETDAVQCVGSVTRTPQDKYRILQFKEQD
jgi:hypothetical protein